MDVTQARAAAATLLATQQPGASDAVLLEGTDDHGWCYVIQWSTQRAIASGSDADLPTPGVGPIAVDKTNGEAFYLPSAPLRQVLDVFRRQRGR
jgi:hypothetical protein